MQPLDMFLGQRFFRMVDHIVDGTEMIDGLDDVINRNSFSDINSIRFKNQSGLILTELAALNVVGIVGHAHLQFMVQTARHTDAFLIPQCLQQGVFRNASV